MKARIKIEVAGKELSPEVMGLLQKATILDEIEQRADSCSISFADPEEKIKKPRKGDELKLYAAIGDDELKLMGRYVIKNLGRDEKTVTVNAKGFDPLKGVRNSATAYYQSKTVAEIVREVAGRNKATVRVSDEFNKVKIDEAQKDESDLSFLQRLARDNHAVIKVQGSQILFIPKSQGRSASGKELAIVELDLKGRGAKYNYDDDDTEEAGQVTAKYYDKKTGDKGEVKVGSGEPSKSLADLYPSEAAARSAAAAKRSSAKEEAEKLKISMPLDLSILGERRTNIKNLSSWVDGLWIVTSARHDITGFRTTLQLRKALKSEE